MYSASQIAQRNSEQYLEARFMRAFFRSCRVMVFRIRGFVLAPSRRATLPLCFCCAAALFVVVFALSLASAISRWRARDAPVRGGTYFSLQRQRKVGKRKPLTPLTPV
jgi:hypothetical protein